MATCDANLNGTAGVLAAVSASVANASADCSVSDSVQLTSDFPIQIFQKLILGVLSGALVLLGVLKHLLAPP